MVEGDLNGTWGKANLYKFLDYVTNNRKTPWDPGLLDASGYRTFEREWKADDTVSLALALPIERMTAHPNIADCRGRVALQRGPLVSGFEGWDHDGNAEVMLGALYRPLRQPSAEGR